ncbi:hypothetical protein EDB86DRAFT_2834971 [Lactarius hatsudake]|nr:hypothetical protein EDB86DRAFT_2834971 [Lactarius hatsudake]
MIKYSDKTASGVSSSYDALVELFECLGNFLKRLQIHTDLSFTPSMREISVKIMVELLSVLALATKQIKQGRFRESEIEGVLRRLDRLNQEEGRMTMAQTLEVVYGLVNNVINGAQRWQSIGRRHLKGFGYDATDCDEAFVLDRFYYCGPVALKPGTGDRLQREPRSWLTPPDPSPNYNTAREIHQDGTATWFCEGSIFAGWCAKGSLLWIHGKAGSGKFILMSAIIREIDRMRKAGLALMAYFFFDFRDTKKQHRRDLLFSLLFQLSARSDACHHIFSQFCLDHDEGVQQPSDVALSHCLMDMLKVPAQPPAYITIDVLDESSNISGIPTTREKVLQFLEDLVNLQLPNVHICVSSRPEMTFGPFSNPWRCSAFFLIHFYRCSAFRFTTESGKMADISGYIKSSCTLTGICEDGQLKIGSWLLVHSRRKQTGCIHSILDHLPETLDETYEHMLRRTEKVKRQFAHRLFQCLAVSLRPLRVEELAEILAVRFDTGSFPQFNTGWRLGDAEEAVLSACSSLITVIDVNGSRIVQFAHFSIKEFLTSDRLATASEDLSHYHIDPHLAHATLAQASLSVLLQLDDRIDKDSVRNIPLADYAARQWFEYGRFGNVSLTI